VGVAKPGFASLQYIGPGAIGGALAGLSGWAGAAVGAAIGALSYDLTTFCPNGPPAPPTFTVTDIAALLSPIPNAARNTAVGKFNDFLGGVFWPILCDCSGGTPVVAAPSTYPANGPQSPPVAPVNPNCEGLTNSNGTPGPWISPSAGPTFWAAGATANPWGYLTWPVSVPTSFRITLKNTIVTGAGVTITFAYEQRLAYSTSHSGGVPTVTVAPGGTQTVVITAIPGRTILELWIDSVTGTGTGDTVGSTMEAFCGGAAPGAPQLPCCPPDPSTQAQLDAILSLVTLIQRQGVPFAYVPGTVHAGLSGAGTIAISGLLGVKVDVTTLPAAIGREGTTPTEYFDLGWVSLGTPDGYPQSARIEHNPQLLLPARCSVNTELAYDLHAGVFVTITELKREP
jgi:hypothetical protein